MNALTSVIVYLTIGTIGGLIGCRFKFPASALLGSCFAVMAFNLLWRHGMQLPKTYTTVIQILVGIMVGASFTPAIFKNLGQVTILVVATTCVLMIAGLGLAALFTWLGAMDPATALLATSPGGDKRIGPSSHGNRGQPSLGLHLPYSQNFNGSDKHAPVIRYYQTDVMNEKGHPLRLYRFHKSKSRVQFPL